MEEERNVQEIVPIKNKLRNFFQNKFWLLAIYFFASIGLISTIYLIVGSIAIKFGTTRTIITPAKNFIATPGPISNTPIPSLEPRVSYPFPSKNIWTEYQPKCLALSNNLRIFLPNGWKQSYLGEQEIADGTDAAKGTKEYEDFMNLTSQCQILLGYPEDPGDHQAAGSKEIFGSVWIQAWKIDISQGEEISLAWWRNHNNNDNGYGGIYNIDSIVERTINDRQWLQMYEYGRLVENWLTVNNSYVVAVRIDNTYQRSNPLLKGYIQQTAEEIINKLMFK